MKKTISKILATNLLRVVLSLQCLLMFLVFRSVILQPNTRLFSDNYDGLKNYFTFYAYLLPENTTTWAKFEWFHYPFGDYILYTDNTPLLSAPLKLISTYLIDLSAYGLAIYNYVIIGSILLSSWLLFLILKRFVSNSWLLGMCSLLLPWIHPQIIRINMHMNLSFTWVILLVIYLLLRLTEQENASKSGYLKACIFIICAVVATSFLHLYYSMILAFLIGGFCIFYAFANRSDSTVGRRFLISAFLIPFVSVLVVLATIKSVDTYYDLRKTGAGGFNWKHFNQYFDAFYSSYEHFTLQFPLHATREITYESFSYLGGFALFGMGILLFLFLSRKDRKVRFSRYLWSTPSGKRMSTIFFAGVVAFFISLGTYARLFNHTISFDNWFNPFYFLSMVSERFTQFRCLARFNWVFFWSFNLLVIYLLNHYVQQKRPFANWIVAVLLGCLLMDSTDMMRHFSKLDYPNLMTDKEATADIHKLIKGINPSEYQAILSAPYFHVGAEENDYILPPIDSWMTKNYQLSIATQLPMMACQMSRTPVNQTKALFSLYTKEIPDQLLLDHLNNKPILLFANESPYVISKSDFEPAKTVTKSSTQFPEKWNLKLLNTYKELKLYELDPAFLK